MTSARIATMGLVVAGTVAALVLFQGCPSRPRSAPDFALPDLSGRVIRMRDLRGKVVVLNLWTTWCPPCVQEMPTLERLHGEMSDEDLVVLAVSQDEKPDLVRPWIEKRAFTFPVLLDPLAETGHALGVSGYPETFVVDRQGTIVHHHIGYRDWAEPQVLGAFRKLLETGKWTL